MTSPIETKQLTNRMNTKDYSYSPAEGGIVWNKYGSRLTVQEAKRKGKYVQIEGRRYYFTDLQNDTY